MFIALIMTAAAIFIALVIMTRRISRERYVNLLAGGAGLLLTAAPFHGVSAFCDLRLRNLAALDASQSESDMKKLIWVWQNDFNAKDLGAFSASDDVSGSSWREIQLESRHVSRAREILLHDGNSDWASMIKPPLGLFLTWIERPAPTRFVELFWTERPPTVETSAKEDRKKFKTSLEKSLSDALTPLWDALQVSRTYQLWRYLNGFIQFLCGGDIGDSTSSFRRASQDRQFRVSIPTARGGFSNTGALLPVRRIASSGAPSDSCSSPASKFRPMEELSDE